MAKHRRDIRATKGADLQRLEHSEVFDDHLLPDAGEIEKLTQIDPDIINWLKSRAEKEQDFRHEAYNSRVTLVDNHNKRDHDTARIALLVYLLLVGGCVVASYFLLQEGRNLEGSMFGGAAVVLAIAVLVTRRQPKNPESK